MRFFGRPDSFHTALTKAMPAIWRYAVSLSGKPDLADELAQATAVRALESRNQFKDGSLEAWCITICRTIWLNQMRAQAVRDRHAISVVDEAEIQTFMSPTETNILAAEVFTKVMQLPEAQRETVVLVYVNGLSYREAADVLGVPVGTVMSRLSAARHKIVDWAEGTRTKTQ